ncbi:MAG: HAD hydrolase-like protein [Acidobacteriota bacterium]
MATSRPPDHRTSAVRIEGRYGLDHGPRWLSSRQGEDSRAIDAGLNFLDNAWELIRFKTALFDVDGTLIDSNSAHAESWAQSLREHGVDVAADQVRPLIGMGGDKLLPAIAHVDAESARGEAITRRKKELFDGLMPGLQPTIGARPLLEYLRDQGVSLKRR